MDYRDISLLIFKEDGIATKISIDRLCGHVIGHRDACLG